ncbi:unnamed protein product [Gadus morhua 'NCC']
MDRVKTIWLSDGEQNEKGSWTGVPTEPGSYPCHHLAAPHRPRSPSLSPHLAPRRRPPDMGTDRRVLYFLPYENTAQPSNQRPVSLLLLSNRAPINRWESFRLKEEVEESSDHRIDLRNPPPPPRGVSVLDNASPLNQLPIG